MAFWIAGISCIIAGSLYSILSFLVLIQDISLGIMLLGSGMVSIGLGIFMIKGFSYMFIKYCSWITKKIGEILLRKDKKDER